MNHTEPPQQVDIGKDKVIWLLYDVLPRIPHCLSPPLHVPACKPCQQQTSNCASMCSKADKISKHKAANKTMAGKHPPLQKVPEHYALASRGLNDFLRSPFRKSCRETNVCPPRSNIVVDIASAIVLFLRGKAI